MRIKFVSFARFCCVAALTSGTLACGTTDLGSSSAARDSAGIRIVHSDASQATSLPQCRLGTTPLVTIGREQVGSEYEFYQIASAAFTPDGEIVLVNRGTKQVRLFGANGQFRRSIGGPGKGPGEFADPIAVVVLPPDSIAVWDWDLFRISVFDSSGDLRRTVGLRPALLNPTGSIGAFHTNAPFVVSFEEIPGVLSSQMKDHRLILARFDGTGGLVDTVATLPYGQRAIVNAEMRMMGSPIFVARGAFAVAGDRLYIADGRRPEVRVISTTGAIDRIIRWLPGDLAVEAADVEAYWNQQMQSASDGWRPILEERRRLLPVADRFPAVATLVPDNTGNLWAQEYVRPRATTQRWLFFNRDGALECTVSLPRSSVVLAATNDRLLVRARDDLDTEYLEIYARAGS